MAENIVAGLFGLTPQMYGEQQRRSALREGIDLAKLTPGEAGAAMTYAGARGLGGAIAGAMGIEDPQLKLISTRNSIFQQIDQSDPESMLQGIRMLGQMGDQQGAMALAEYYRKAQSEGALTEQRLAAGKASLAQAQREQQQKTPEKIQIAEYLSKLNLALDNLNASPASPERDEAINKVSRTIKALELQIEKPDKLISSGVDRDAYSRQMFNNKVYVDLTPAQQEAVNKRLEDLGVTKAREGAPKVYAPEQPIAPKDWENFTLNVLSKDPIMQDTSKILAEGPKLINIIKNSTANDISAAALPKALASFIGKDSSLSNLDTATFARTGGLDDRLAADVNKFFTGRATEVKKDQAERFAIALYRGALLERKKKLETAAEEFGYETSPNYKKSLKNIDAQLAQFKLVKKGESAPTKTGNPLVDKWLSTDAEKK